MAATAFTGCHLLIRSNRLHRFNQTNIKDDVALIEAARASPIKLAIENNLTQVMKHYRPLLVLTWNTPIIWQSLSSSLPLSIYKYTFIDTLYNKQNADNGINKEGFITSLASSEWSSWLDRFHPRACQLSPFSYSLSRLIQALKEFPVALGGNAQSLHVRINCQMTKTDGVVRPILQTVRKR